MLKFSFGKEQNKFLGNSALDSDSICLPLVGPCKDVQTPSKANMGGHLPKSKTNQLSLTAGIYEDLTMKLEIFLMAV